MLLLHVVNLHFITSTVFGIVRGQSPGFLKGAVRQLVPSGLYDYMGSRRSFSVEPPVAAGGEGEGKLVVLQVVLSYIHMVAVTGNIVQGLVGELYFLF